MTLAEGLAQSINTIAVQVAERAGIPHVIAVANRLGITSELARDASIALGTNEVNLLELVSAYAPFANGGNGVLAYGITEIRDSAGKIIYRRTGSGPGQVVAARRGRADERDAGRGHRATAPARPPRCRAPPPARPARPRIIATPGSSATPPTSSPACGSATTTTRAMEQGDRRLAAGARMESIHAGRDAGHAGPAVARWRTADGNRSASGRCTNVSGQFLRVALAANHRRGDHDNDPAGARHRGAAAPAKLIISQYMQLLRF